MSTQNNVPGLEILGKYEYLAFGNLALGLFQIGGLVF